MGKKIFAEISKKYFGVGPVLVQGGPDLVQGGPLLVQGGPLLVQPRVSSTEKCGTNTKNMGLTLKAGNLHEKSGTNTEIVGQTLKMWD